MTKQEIINRAFTDKYYILSILVKSNPKPFVDLLRTYNIIVEQNDIDNIVLMSLIEINKNNVSFINQFTNIKYDVRNLSTSEKEALLELGIISNELNMSLNRTADLNPNDPTANIPTTPPTNTESNSESNFWGSINWGAVGSIIGGFYKDSRPSYQEPREKKTDYVPIIVGIFVVVLLLLATYLLIRKK